MDGSISQELFQYWVTVQAYFAFDTDRLSDTDTIVRVCIQLLLLGGSAGLEYVNQST